MRPGLTGLTGLRVNSVVRVRACARDALNEQTRQTRQRSSGFAAVCPENSFKYSRLSRR